MCSSMSESISHTDFFALLGSCYTITHKQNKLLIPDNYNSKIMIIDCKDLKNLSTIEVDQWLAHPTAIGLNSREIYVAGDSKSDGVAVFDYDFSFKRKFDVSVEWSEPKSMTADENFVYIAHENDRVTKWCCESGVQVSRVEITNPGNMRVKGECIYVISETCVNKENQKTIETGLNCVLVLNKNSLEIERKVCVENWLQPRALHFKDEQLLVVSHRIEQTGLVSKANVLYIFDSSQKLIDQLEIKNVDHILDMTLIDNHLFLIELAEFWTLIKFDLP